MAEPTGFLYKTTSAVIAPGVIGQRCAEWDQPPDPPPAPSSLTPPPDNPSPPDFPPSAPCPATTIIYWSEIDSDGKKTCYANRTWAVAVIEVPAHCVNTIFIPWTVPCNQAGA